MPAVSNTSPIFNLACINRLTLLRDQFKIVWIPQTVEAELRNIPDDATRKLIEEASLDGWLKTRNASNATLISLLRVDLHQGEAEAIALALEMKTDRLLIDERDGRMAARQLGLPVTGVLGVLLRGKKTGRIPRVKPELDALRTKAHFFIAPELEAAILADAGEQAT
jgi:predicted nucleic acid-binding protein